MTIKANHFNHIKGDYNGYPIFCMDIIGKLYLYL